MYVYSGKLLGLLLFLISAVFSLLSEGIIEIIAYVIPMTTNINTTVARIEIK